MRVIFSGSGEFGLPTLEALVAGGHEIVELFTQPNRPAGRGKKLTPTPVGAWADAHHLSPIRTENINRENLVAADVMVVIAFGQKIGPHVVHHPRLGSVNLHSSRLPKFRGAAPINWAILKGEAVTGNSVIRLAQKMDAGAIVGQSELPIGETETAGELHDRLAQDGAGLVLRVLDELQSGTATELLQDESAATLAPKLNRQATLIDWARPAVEVSAQIRGLYPWPGCRVRLVGPEGAELARVTLARSRSVPGAAPLPGFLNSQGLIATGDGLIDILELQPEGKRPMPLKDYRNGRPWPAGARLESIA
ncbi:MAG TPA: methionyl-tRNA formyltransferase [Tepidisphaeraceae bacterium]